MAPVFFREFSLENSLENSSFFREFSCFLAHKDVQNSFYSLPYPFLDSPEPWKDVFRNEALGIN